MNRKKILTFVFFAVFFLFCFNARVFAAPSIGGIIVQSLGSTVQQFTKFEISFPVTTVATNKFYQYDASPPTGVEKNANGRGVGVTVDMLILPKLSTNWANAKIQACFWFQPYVELPGYLVPTGKAEWRCRVGTPDLEGYKFKIQVKDSSGISESAENTFNVVANTSNNATKKGYIKVSTRDPRFFEYSDGTPFFTPLVNVEVNNFNSLDGIRSNIADLSDSSVRFVRWFPTKETGYLYFFAGDVSGGWGNIPDSKTDDVDTQKGKKFSIAPDDEFTTQTFAAVPGGQYRLTLRAHVPSSNTLKARISFAGGNSEEFTIPGDSTCNQINVCFKDYSFSITNSNSSQNNVSVNFAQTSASGPVRISDVVFQRLENKDGESGLWGGNLLQQGDADTYSFVDQVQAAKMDELLKQSENLGVYHKMPLFWKEDFALWKLTETCTVGETSWWLTFDDPTCSGWYQRNYARYFAARFSYSTAIHSLEYANEHDPGSGTNAILLSNFVRDVSNRKILMSDSYYHWGNDMMQLDPSTWLNPAIDFMDRHWYAAPSGGGPSAIYSDKKTDPTQYSRACVSSARSYNATHLINKPYVQAEGGSMNSDYGEDPAPSNDSYDNWYHKKLWANVGALGTTCDGEWWPKLWDSSPLFPIYKSYSVFLEGEPLSNGSHVEIGTDNLNYGTTSCSLTNNPNCIDDTATSPNTNLRAYGSKDSATARVLVWVDNKNNTWNNNPAGAPAQSATYEISGMPNGTYIQEIWNTRTGVKSSVSNVSVGTNGILTFTASGITTDKAYKFYQLCGATGDIDCSGQVNALDLVKLIFDFFTDSSVSDLDGSGQVNSLDLAILINNYGK